MEQSTVDMVEGRVPGGRKKSTGGDDLSIDDEEEGAQLGFGPASAKLNPQHRHVSQSLPRVAPDPRSLGTLPNDFNKSYTLDRKKNHKLRGLRSFGSFMHRMARHVSQVSIHAPSPKFGKKKSLPITTQSIGTATDNPNPISDTATTGGDSGEEKSPQYKQNNLKFDKNRTPGVVGLRNHGNTCFMNAVLQCLSHTELLVEYFLTDQYKNDIKRNNKHNSKKYGTRGELTVTEHLAVLLKSLWTCQYTSELSNDFKTVVGKYGSQYRGCAQHDAQEFLMWLLDKVHEDLNIATKKKYRSNKSSVGRSDEIVAAEALANHMRCNNSFMYDLFQALYRSSLSCPNCHRQSNTFDPFLSVSLPIPQRVKRPAYVTVAYLDAQPRQVRIGLLLNQTDTVAELRHTLAIDTKIPEKQLVLTEIYYDGFHRTFHDSQPLSDIHETDNIYAIETPSSAAANETEASRYLLLVVLNKQIAGTQAKRFGGPLVLRVLRDSGFLDLQNIILEHMTSMLRDGIIAQKMGVLFKLRIVDGLTSKTYLPHDVDHPLFMPAVERALTTCVPGGGPPHVKLLVEWDQQTMQCMIVQSSEVTEEHSSVRQVSLAYQQPLLGTLDECFQLYTQEEKLEADNAWHCSNCKKRQQGSTKSLSLWSLPDVLVIHLKRFKQIGLRRTKLNTLITFPVSGLDTSVHVTKRNLTPQNNKTATGWSPWRPNRRAPCCKEDYLYDLYAVCNHYGNMQGGHYTGKQG